MASFDPPLNIRGYYRRGPERIWKDDGVSADYGVDKITAVTGITLLAVQAVGFWALFAVGQQRKQVEVHQIEAATEAALAGQAHNAWTYATRYDTFFVELANSKQEPKKNEALGERDVWVTAYQRSDIKFAGKSAKYGNESYLVNTVVAFRDHFSESMMMAAVHSKMSEQMFFLGMRGMWQALTMQCKVERLDGGD